MKPLAARLFVHEVEPKFQEGTIGVMAFADVDFLVTLSNGARSWPIATNGVLFAA
jgi:hypothetical protein